ncbi:MAG: hypothetical protein AB7I30_07765 [Isosphaeraceae bacterium]
MTNHDRRRTRRAFGPLAERMESRQVPSTVAPDLAVLSAGTVDSRGVTVGYEVRGANLQTPPTFTVYRSADATLDAGDPRIAEVAAGALDADGLDATAPGTHRVDLPLADGLPPNPSRPYVIVQADPMGTPGESNVSNDAATFRKHTVGVITHGGVQPQEWRQGPPWQIRMARQLQDQGYENVISYNWVPQSDDPGAAARQGPRLASMIADAVAAFPPGEAVDVHLIGHSEGAVVNSEAVLALNQAGWPAAADAGYLKVTMLDPHAANNGLKGQQYSVSNGVLGYIARMRINDFQSKAQDPLPVVPENVEGAEVFYQRTPVSQTFGSNDGIYNLWGQVPVRGQARHFDLTAPGISHSGKFGVQDWYRLNVVPTLGDGAPAIERAGLIGWSMDATQGTSSGRRAHYAGQAAPGAIVRLMVGTGEEELSGAGATHAGPDGRWHLATPPLSAGRYRVVAVSNAPVKRGERPMPIKPTAWLGSIEVAPAWNRG